MRPHNVTVNNRHAGRIDVLINNFGTSNPGKDLDFANTAVDVFGDLAGKTCRR